MPRHADDRDDYDEWPQRRSANPVIIALVAGGVILLGMIVCAVVLLLGRRAAPNQGGPPAVARADEPPARPERGPPPRDVTPGTVDGRTLAERQAIYRKLAARWAKVRGEIRETLGPKPGPDAPEVERRVYEEFEKGGRMRVVVELEVDEQVPRGHAAAILAEGERLGWPTN